MNVLLLLSALAAPGSPTPDAADIDRQTILFIGDSITYAGHYVDRVDLAYRLQAAKAGTLPPDVLNIGLGSETVCGLTEPGHPFPRPNVHSRLKRALARIKPDLVYACYGMNDGIYQPFSEERFECYAEGMRTLVRDVLATGAELVVLTPPPFDAKGRRDNNKPLITAAQFAAGLPGLYDGYDDVLARYADFVRSLPTDPKFSDRPLSIIDTRTPLLAATIEGRRTNPTYTLTPDGIHPRDTGHAIIAAAILQARSLPSLSHVASETRKLIRHRSTLLRDAWLTAIGHDRPGTAAGRPLLKALLEAASIDQALRAELQNPGEPRTAAMGRPTVLP